MKKKMLIFLSYVLVATISAAAAFGVSAWRTPGTGKLPALEAMIEEMFIGESDVTALEDAAADAMVRATGDRWSYYIPAKEYAAYNERMENAYVGVGITITAHEDGGFQIMAVTPDSGAAEAGLMVEDVLIAVQGQDIREQTVDAVRDLVRGPEGTQVQLTLLRAGEEMTVSVERRRMQTPVAVGEMLPDQVGYIAIENFDARCAEETIAQIETLRQQGARKLIFDVRNNPGGYADELVKVLDYLLPEGELFRSELYDGKQNVDLSDESFLDMPMAVLVNADSYSAAEFFAAAMQEYGAGVVVGEKTVGKGYFQNTFRFEDGSAVALSIGKYFTPKGVSLADVGVTPDVECSVEEETAAAIYYGVLPLSEDPQINAAMEALR